MTDTLVPNYVHRHSAHCESGAFAGLLRHHGIALSEPMTFGIGSGLFFLYLPAIKIYGAPLVSYRDMPNAILGRGSKRLGVRINKQRYRDPQAGMRALDEALARGQPVGLQTGVFWLPYFPRDMRFQFNGHHIIAYGKQQQDYLLSDSVFEEVVRCSADDLQRARFAKGPLAPKGLLYTIESADASPDVAAAVRAAIPMTVARMLSIPIPYMGVRGIRTLARAVARWPTRLGPDKARSWLAATIRMQEEVGTGGGGFRFMYAAFLAEAAELLATPAIHKIAAALSASGDQWREFAVQGAKVIRGTERSVEAYAALAAMIERVADIEADAFKRLRSVDLK